MRIAFFGLPLAALLLARDGHEIALAVLSPLPAPGRRRVRRVARADALLEPEPGAPVDERWVDSRLASATPDLVVSWFWTRRLPARWLSAAAQGAIGVHPSLLPRHRGPDPFYAAIDAGDAVTGVSVHRLEAEYDTGAVLLQERLEIGERDAWQLARALDRPSLRALRAVVRRLEAGPPLTERAQREADATWAPRPEAEGLGVDFRWPSARIERRVRALGPWPGLALTLAGLPIEVLRVTADDGLRLPVEPGEAVVLDADRSPARLSGHPPAVVAVRTGSGAVLVDRARVDDEVLGRAALAVRVLAVVCSAPQEGVDERSGRSGEGDA